MATDENASGRRRRLGLNARFAIGLGIAAVVVVGGGFGLEALQGGFGSAPTVTVRNDTGSSLDWSCTKSTCPDPSQLTDGARFTATAWVRDFTCP